MSNYLKHLALARIPLSSRNLKIISRSAGNKSLAQKLLNNEVKLVGIDPPKGDPSWNWYSESSLDDPKNSLPEASMLDFQLADGTEELESEPKQRGSPEIKFAKFGDKMVEIPNLLKELILSKLKGTFLVLFSSNPLYSYRTSNNYTLTCILWVSSTPKPIVNG